MTQIIQKNASPSAIELEEAILGGIMLDKEAIYNIVTTLLPEHFYLDSHRQIYQAMLDLYSKTAPIDLLTVTEQLRENGTLKHISGGPAYIVELTNKVASSANMEWHARIVRQKAIRRQAMDIGLAIFERAQHDTEDPLAIIDSLQEGVFKMGMGLSSQTIVDGAKLAKDELQRALSIRKQTGLLGLPVGIKVVDEKFRGLKSPDLHIWAARPGMGKTSFMLSCALNQAKMGIPVLIFSLEMDTLQLAIRLVAILSGVASQRVEDPRDRTDEEEDLWESAVAELSNLPIYIDDTPGITLMEVNSKSRRMAMEKGIKIVYIDYLQLMTGPSNAGNREQEISAISRGLKGLAKQLRVPVVALCQLSRAVESKNDRRPELSHLRESGSLEQDADIVSFLFRPEYYADRLTIEQKAKYKNVCIMIVAKFRGGATGDVWMKFVPALTKFSSLDPVDDQPMPIDDIPEPPDDEDLPF